MSEPAVQAAADVLRSGYIGQGEVVDRFEDDLKRYFNHDHVVTVNSATSGLHLAIRLATDNIRFLGYEDEIEVLTTPLTCTATNWPILADGHKIKWVDVDSRDLNIDLTDLERKLSPKTRIIVVVHWGGYPVNLERLEKIQQRCRSLYGFTPKIIQDCAHAMGSKFAGVHVGSYPIPSSTAVYSFQAIKHMTTVDGGAMLTTYGDYPTAKLLRWYGIDRESNRKDFRCEANVPNWGYKFHMNDVNAAIGIENLKVVDKFINIHKDNGRFFDDALFNVNGVNPLFTGNKKAESAYWIYSMKVDRQDDFMRAMADRKVTVSRVHERNDKHSTVRQFAAPLPTLDRVVKEMICIPCGWWVTKEDREYIVDQIKKGW